MPESSARLGLIGLSLVTCLSLAACGTQEKPPVIDLTTPIKTPSAAPAVQTVTPESPTAK